MDFGDFSFGDLLGSLGSIGQGIGTIGGALAPFLPYILPQPQQSYSQPSYGPPQSYGPPMPMFDMGEFLAMFEPPDYSQMFAGMNEMFANQQAASLEEQRQQQMKNLTRQAVSTRRNMQNQGVYEGGAVSEDALANLMGVDDRDLFKQGLKTYGSEYGWT